MGKGDLHNKYKVEKTEGPTDPNADYFVLRIDKDPHAMFAAKAYAISVMNDNPTLGKQLFAVARNYELTHNKESSSSRSD